MSELRQVINLDKIEKNYFPDTYFWDGISKFRHMLSDSWYVGGKRSEIKEKLIDNSETISYTFEEQKGDYLKVLFTEGEYSRTLFLFNNGYVSVTVVCNEEELGKRIVKKFRDSFPLAEYAEEDELKVKFWYQPHNEFTRKIKMTSWDEISGNYAANIQAEMNRLIAMTPDDISAKLLLWYGPPGTGKSFALRCLAYEWRDWCRFEYITDPDRFFDNPAYMTHVILRDTDDLTPASGPGIAYYDEDDFAETGEEIGEKQWKLLILEDSGEMIQKDSKSTHGQALSRLLNMVDGFIGQGMNVMVLITTNEMYNDLNTAVSRAGRCLSKAEFKALSKDEANDWLQRNDVEATTDSAVALADLYAKKNDPEYSLPKLKQVGFRTGSNL